MENAQIYSITLSLIRSEMGVGDTAQVKSLTLSDEEIKTLVKFAHRHSLDHLITSALLKNGLLDKRSDFAKKAEQSLLRTVITDERRNYDIINISKLFEENNIDFILLKGSVMRNYYPERWMRSSCDIDILVKDIKKACEVLECSGYSKIKEGSHDVLFVSAAKIGIELHFRLIETNDKISEVLSYVWETATPNDNTKHNFVMSNEMFRFYHIAHMSKHFLFGGCGIRFFIDLWLLNRNQSICVEEYEKLLEQGGLLTFARRSQELADAWMNGEQIKDTLSEMADFVLNGGIFGTTDNVVKISRTKYNNKFTFMLYRIFMPHCLMRLKYPILEKWPVLLPFYWVRRWFEFLFAPKKRENAKNETRLSGDADGESIYRMKNLLDSLELK